MIAWTTACVFGGDNTEQLSIKDFLDILDPDPEDVAEGEMKSSKTMTPRQMYWLVKSKMATIGNSQFGSDRNNEPIHATDGLP